MEVITRDEAIARHLTRYFTGDPCKHGHVAQKTVKDRSCVECSRLRTKAHREKDPEKARRDCIESELRLKELNPELWQQKRKQWRQRVKDKHGPIKYMYSVIRDRAKRKGLEFTIEREDISIPSHCPILGIPLYSTPGRKTDNTPSIDRIDNTRGYVKGNIHVISERANRFKNNATIDELEKLVAYLRRIQDHASTCN